MNKKTGVLFAAALVLSCAVLLPAGAQRYPAYRGYVNDFAGVIKSDAVGKITTIASELEEKTTAQIAVVTVATIQPETIEDYAVTLFEKWGIGQKGKDNGVLILLAVNDRKVRIEVGYGLEGALTDAMSSAIVQQAMIPRFKEGGYSEGILAGAAAAANIVAGEYNTELIGLVSVPESHYKVKAISPGMMIVRTLITLVFFILFFGMRTGLLFFWLFGSGRRRGGYWYGTGVRGSGGGFSGGFGGFGGGLSGGGGASGGW